MVVTIQEIIDGIEAGSRAQKEILAQKVVNAENFLHQTERNATDAQLVIDRQLATDWWNTTIQPTLVWNNSNSNRSTCKYYN